jgi:hypothetical protein
MSTSRAARGRPRAPRSARRNSRPARVPSCGSSTATSLTSAEQAARHSATYPWGYPFGRALVSRQQADRQHRQRVVTAPTASGQIPGPPDRTANAPHQWCGMSAIRTECCRTSRAHPGDACCAARRRVRRPVSCDLQPRILRLQTGRLLPRIRRSGSGRRKRSCATLAAHRAGGEAA